MVNRGKDNSHKSWLVCSLIHKFGRHINPETGKEEVGDDNANIPLEKYLEELQALLKAKYPNGFKAKGEHKFVFVDECHRTQGGRLHEAMRAIMGGDVMFIGFTGTPLLHEEKKKAVTPNIPRWPMNRNIVLARSFTNICTKKPLTIRLSSTCNTRARCGTRGL